MKRLMLVPLLLALCTSCADRPITTSPADSEWRPLFYIGNHSGCGGGTHELEEEVFGCLWVNSNEEYTVSLMPGEGGQPTYFSSWMLANLAGYSLNSGAHWGWYDDPSNCYLNGQRIAERHGGEGLEAHCITFGRFTWTITREQETLVTLPVDYIQYRYQAANAGTTVSIADNGLWGPHPGTDINLQYTEESDGFQPIVQAAVSVAPLATGLGPGMQMWYAPPSQPIHVPRNLPVRVGAWASTSTWELSDYGRLLVRYFWDFNNDPTNATGWANVWGEASVKLARSKNYATLGARVLRVVVREPDGDTAFVDVSLLIDSVMDAQPSGPSTLYRGVPATFSAATAAGAVQWRWSLTNGTPLCDWQAQASCAIAFSSNGARWMRLEVRNQSWAVDMDSIQVTVVDPPPPLSVGLTSEPTPVRPNKSCWWSAQASGGTPPLAYQWYRSGVSLGVAGQSQSVRQNTGSSNFWMRVTVTDAALATVSESTFVTVSSSSPLDCVY